MFAGIFSCTPSFSPEINKVYLILSYLMAVTSNRMEGFLGYYFNYNYLVPLSTGDFRGIITGMGLSFNYCHGYSSFVHLGG